MRQTLLLAFATVAVSQLGFAGACASGSLASYVSLGSTGCTIGGDTLYNFKTLTGSAGATAIAASLVTINPTGSTYSLAITISTNQTAAGGAALETIFTYNIAGSLYTGIFATLGNSSETGAGGVTGLVNVCQGGNFGPDGVDGCAHPTSSLLTADGFQNSDMAAFGKVSSLNVTDDFQIDGPATAGTLSNTFAAVPEPLTSAMAALGFLLVGVVNVRAKRAQRERN
jgi:hypothetical protein